MGPELFMSEKAEAVVIDLLKKSENRNPDAFDMYVYNGEQHVERLYSFADRRTTYSSREQTFTRMRYMTLLTRCSPPSSRQ